VLRGTVDEHRAVVATFLHDVVHGRAVTTLESLDHARAVLQQFTRQLRVAGSSPATADGPRDAPCQSTSCQTIHGKNGNGKKNN